MDGLSAAASVIAVLQISGQAFDLCRAYYLEVKEARKDIQRLRDEVTSLNDVLTNVVDLAEDQGPAKRSILSILNQHDGPVQQCQQALAGLIAKLEFGQRKNKMNQFGLRALKWPLTSKDVEKLLVTIGRHKATFTLALTADHIGLARAIKDDIASLSDGLTKLQIEQRTLVAREQRQTIYQWLSSPDTSSNHNSACKARQAMTGAWLLRDERFEGWKSTLKSFLWLYGIPGCGKTILCSTVIEHVKSCYGSDPTVAIAYFYFDFNDTEKQRHEKLLRSLIEQLSLQSVKSLEALNALFARYQNGDREQQLTPDALASTLQHMLRDFQQTFIIIDALDECKEREDLLGLLENLMSWKAENLHVLATSRRERDIEETLESLATGQVCIQSALVNADIHIHLCSRIQNDPKLKKWPEHVQREIEKTLMDGAHGMFRWVVCQLDVLRKCLKLDALRRALKSLPKTLDDTYARILCSIDEEYIQDAFKILQWLAYSARPLRIEEVAEVIAVDIDNSRFDLENRLREHRDVLTICSSLVTTAVSTSWIGGVSCEIEELRLAHFSVKEYLISDRVPTGPAFRYNIQERAEDRIAQTCLIYLLQFKGSILRSPHDVDGFPLARYAAEYWTRHARAATNTVPVNQLSVQLFQKDAMINWIRLCDPHNPWTSFEKILMRGVASPLYYASLEGLVESAACLLDSGADVNTPGGFYTNALEAASDRGHEAVVALLLDKGANVNGQHAYGGSILQMISANGHEAIVMLLLQKGADVNAQGGAYGSALQAASARGHEAIVLLLLEKGAEVNTLGGKYGSALQRASAGGHKAILMLLLEKGAEVNTLGGKYGSALQAASAEGHEAIVMLLLDKGANANAQHKYHSSALQMAAAKGHKAIVMLLLQKGAEANTLGGEYGSALQAALAGGHDALVMLLLKKGAEVNTLGGKYGSALQIASGRGDEAFVMLLLEKGADVNALGGECGSALQAASGGGYEAIVRLLLEKGANVNARGGRYGCALQIASAGGNKAIVILLLEKGAEMNTRAEDYSSALQAASAEGHEAIVILLLEKGAEVNTLGGAYGSALQAASAGGHEAIVVLLLHKGADLNAEAHIYGTALQRASAGGHKAIVMLLLEKGADVNAQGYKCGTALQRASGGGHKAIVMLLLENGAKVNTLGGERGSALQVASAEGHEAIVILLLEKGAEVNTLGGAYGSALQAASERGHEAIVMLLLEKGADINANSSRYGSALQRASAGGHEAIVMLLLEKGAKVNSLGGKYGSALQMASGGGRMAIVMLLLEKGAEVNSLGGDYGSALQRASAQGHEAIAVLLLQRGADVNALGGKYGSALQMASAKGHNSIVALLLEKGAKVNAQDGIYGRYDSIRPRGLRLRQPFGRQWRGLRPVLDYDD